MRKLRSSTKGGTELHLLDAHPTAYFNLYTEATELQRSIVAAKISRKFVKI